MARGAFEKRLSVLVRDSGKVTVRSVWEGIDGHKKQMEKISPIIKKEGNI